MIDKQGDSKAYFSNHMKVKTVLQPKKLLFLLTVLALNACASISGFDQYAYIQSTSLKVDAMALMDLATEEYAAHAPVVKDLQRKIEKAYEYEKHRPKNSLSAGLWEKLKDPRGNLLGGFLLLWKEEGKAGKVYILEKKKQVGQAFDIISELESKKIKPSQVSADIVN